MEEQYLNHLKEILASDYSFYKPNRTAVDSISLFGYQSTYDLQEGFPLLTTKKVYTRAIIHELIWLLRGDTNLKYLVDNNVRIWNEWGFQRYVEEQGLEIEEYSEEWNKKLEEYVEKIKQDSGFAEKHGDLGPVYGKQWRHWEAKEDNIDQLLDAVNKIKKKSPSRRIIVTAWNPADVKDMALPPCHSFYQMVVRGEYLDLQLYQRSADMFLGVPFNIASYSMLTHILAKQAGLKPGRFIHTFGDSHIYCGAGERGKFYEENLEELKKKVRKAKTNEDFKEILNWVEENAPDESEDMEGQDHVTAVLEQLSRTPTKPPLFEVADKHFEDLTIDDFEIKEYNPYPMIKRNVAV